MNGQTSLQGWTIIPMPQTMQHKEDIALLPMCGRINEARAVGDDRHILAVQLIDDIRAAIGLEWNIATGDHWPGFITLPYMAVPMHTVRLVYARHHPGWRDPSRAWISKACATACRPCANSSVNAAPPCPTYTSRTNPPSEREAITSA